MVFSIEPYTNHMLGIFTPPAPPKMGGDGGGNLSILPKT